MMMIMTMMTMRLTMTSTMTLMMTMVELTPCQDNATALVLPLGSWGKAEGTSGMFYSFGREMSNSSRFG